MDQRSSACATGNGADLEAAAIGEIPGAAARSFYRPGQVDARRNGYEWYATREINYDAA